MTLIQTMWRILELDAFQAQLERDLAARKQQRTDRSTAALKGWKTKRGKAV